MPLKISKIPQKSPPQSRAEYTCSEQDLAELAELLKKELQAGESVFLEGALGAGKSTFARALIQAFCGEVPGLGSPTFSIVHEYRCSPSHTQIQEVIHMDLYRLQNAQELREIGIFDYFSSYRRSAVVFCEWASLWPEVSQNQPGYDVRLDFLEDPLQRKISLIRRPLISSTDPSALKRS